MENSDGIRYLFEPRSVAVIGASRNKTKIGYKILENILAGKYPGKIYPVNPAGGELLGLPVYKKLDEIDGEIDLVLISIPAERTFAAVRDCAHKGAKHLAIITSGFSEAGNLEGEKEITNYARKYGTRVLGPNIFGIYSSKLPLNATFGPGDIKGGHVAVLTQSGALGIAMIGKTKIENIGLSAVVSVGNKSDIDEVDLLEYLEADENTKVILIYLEGVKNGKKLIGALKRIVRKKPVIVIKSGKSQKGAMAAASHTGSLAVADEIFSDIMKQCGALRAESIEEALNWCKFLSSVSPPKGENTVVITNGGGMGVLAADACEKYGVNLYDDNKVLEEIFAGITPEFGSTKNPVDLTGEAVSSDYEKALNVAFKSNQVHAIICLGCETAVLDSEELTGIIKKIFQENRPLKPFVLSFLGGSAIEKFMFSLAKTGVPVFSDVDDAVSCLGAMYGNYRNMNDRPGKIEEIKINTGLIENILKKAQKEQRRFLLSYEASDVLRALDIRMPQSYVARNIDESVMYADKIGYPVVLKVVSRNILHKSDVGGVALNLENKNEVMNAFQAIIYNCRKHKPNALIEGVEVTEMVRRGGDVETIIGARRDESFGPLVMFGLGGIYVEIMKDVSFRSFPVSKKEAMDMIREIKSYPLLLGVRGETKKDINAVVDTILKVGTALQRFREISDIELNPLLVHDEGEGTRALDVRILLAKPEEVEINEKDGRYVSKQERRENLFNCRPGQSLGQRIWLP